MRIEEIEELENLKKSGVCFVDDCGSPRKYAFLCQNHHRLVNGR